jgi:hypothetical protein
LPKNCFSPLSFKIELKKENQNIHKMKRSREVDVRQIKQKSADFNEKLKFYKVR